MLAGVPGAEAKGLFHFPSWAKGAAWKSLVSLSPPRLLWGVSAHCRVISAAQHGWMVPAGILLFPFTRAEVMGGPCSAGSYMVYKTDKSLPEELKV